MYTMNNLHDVYICLRKLPTRYIACHRNQYVYCAYKQPFYASHVHMYERAHDRILTHTHTRIHYINSRLINKDEEKLANYSSLFVNNRSYLTSV